LVCEKIAAYSKRTKIRDLYDIFFLLRYITNMGRIKEKLNLFIKNFKEPVDKNELKVLIIEGIVPEVEKMMDYIKNKI